MPALVAPSGEWLRG